jgi:cytochrome c biogenesis protein CcmG, thiol:disulfide interchange protein DsbE
MNKLVLASLFIGAVAHAEVKLGDRAIDIDKSTRSGSHFKLSALRGKVVLVDFWASWCEPCKKELPMLGRLAPKLRDKGIEIVAVNIDDDVTKADSFLHEKGISSLTVVRDEDKKLVGAYEPEKMPTSFVVDKAGVVRAVNAGFEDGDDKKLEQQLLGIASK